MSVTESAFRKPEQAAFTSNENTSLAPSLASSTQARLGNW